MCKTFYCYIPYITSSVTIEGDSLYPFLSPLCHFLLGNHYSIFYIYGFIFFWFSLLIYLVLFFFYILQMSVIIQFLSFSIWVISLSTKPSRSSMLSQMTIFHISSGLLLIVFHRVCGYSRSIVFPYNPNFLTKNFCNLAGGLPVEAPTAIL